MTARELPLDRASLAAQWLRVLARVPVTPGRRQEDFLPLEAVLCAAAALIVDHHHYGGSTSFAASSPVPELGALFRRTNASILAKMANVDGSRPHGAKQDSVIAIEILGRPERLAEVYTDILATARRAGIASNSLPDFLGVESFRHDIELLGQGEIESDLASAVEAQLLRWAILEDSPVTARLAEVNLRIGQHRFARGVLENYGRCCGFCGLSVPAGTGRGLLRAGHIKPWALSSGHERLDVRNGVAACPTHDAAFDSGLLTVNGGLRIHVSRALAEMASRDEPIRHAFGRPPLHATLLLPSGAVAPAQKYLDWHHEHVWAA